MSDVEWVADKSLPVLIRQVDQAAPDRSKASDGIKGDEAHAARESQHNPEHPPPPGNPDYQVDAADVTHDPAHGADMAVVAEALRASRDRRIQYVIFRRRIFYSTPRNGYDAWEWQPYNGDDPHTGHLHITVNDTYHDQTQLWQIGLDMALTEDDLNKIADRVWAKKFATYIPDGEGKRPLRTVADTLFAAHQVADTAAKGAVQLLARPTADVNEAELARLLAEDLAPHLPEGADPAAIAAAVLARFGAALIAAAPGTGEAR